MTAAGNGTPRTSHPRNRDTARGRRGINGTRPVHQHRMHICDPIQTANSGLPRATHHLAQLLRWHWCSIPSSRDLIVGDLKLHLSWETDEACLAVMAYHFPDAIQRGDLLRDSPDEIAALIRQHDPEQERIIIAAAGPPCPDFSQVNGSASGREGPEGSKFVFYCDFVGRLETMLPQHRFEHLTENVRMQDRSEMNFFSEKLRATPIIIDSSDLGLINRPRLWWTRIDWTQVKTNPIHQRPLKWSKVDKIYRLHLDVDYTETSSIDTDTLQCHPTITNHQTRIPCLTTPAAPTNEGRAAPRRLKGKIHPTVVARPLPVRPMVLRGMCTTDLLRWETPPHPSLRQGATPWVCQGIYPSGRGDRQVTPQDDGQLLAKFLMVLLLQHACSTAATGSATPSIPRPPQQTALQRILQITTRTPPSIGPGPWTNDPPLLPPVSDSFQHWQAAQRAHHPGIHPGDPEPGLTQTIKAWKELLPDLNNLRRAAVAEIHEMIEDFQPETRQWFSELYLLTSRRYTNNRPLHHGSPWYRCFYTYSSWRGTPRTTSRASARISTKVSKSLEP